MLTTYKSLSTKYRPRKFSDVLGQDHILSLLNNAIQFDKLYSTFLLSGTRGIGKTSTARLIAMALNCTSLKKKKAEPCSLCQNCFSIINNTQPDVVELDAASNTGIEDIRVIIESSKYKPFTIRNKVFIIDEIHMLSKSAFNALLKIIETPPAYVKFILITTEIRKIPLTIISRCQRLDLQPVRAASLSIFLQYISNKEGYLISKDATIIIAKAAHGSIRDALSILDQAILISEQKKITLTIVMNMLSIINFNKLSRVFYDITSGNIRCALFGIREIYYKGASIDTIIVGLINLVYKIILCKLNIMTNLVVLDIELNFCKEQARNLSILTIIRIWQMLQKSMQNIDFSYDKLSSLEISVIQVIHSNFVITPEELLEANSNITKNTVCTIKKKINLTHY